MGRVPVFTGAPGGRLKSPLPLCEHSYFFLVVATPRLRYAIFFVRERQCLLLMSAGKRSVTGLEEEDLLKEEMQFSLFMGQKKSSLPKFIRRVFLKRGSPLSSSNFLAMESQQERVSRRSDVMLSMSTCLRGL